MQTSSKFLVCGLLSISCIHPDRRAAPIVESPREVPMVRLLELQVQREGQSVKAAPDSSLRPGEDFAVRLSSEGPTYVYAVKTLPDGQSQVLDPPPPAASPVRPAGELRVPAADRWLRIESLPPKAHVCLLLSTRTLTADELRCSVGGTRGPDEESPPPVESSRAPEPPLPPPPGPDRGRRSSSVTSIPLWFTSGS